LPKETSRKNKKNYHPGGSETRRAQGNRFVSNGQRKGPTFQGTRTPELNLPLTKRPGLKGRGGPGSNQQGHSFWRRESVSRLRLRKLKCTVTPQKGKKNTHLTGQQGGKKAQSAWEKPLRRGGEKKLEKTAKEIRKKSGCGGGLEEEAKGSGAPEKQGGGRIQRWGNKGPFPERKDGTGRTTGVSPGGGGSGRGGV